MFAVTPHRNADVYIVLEANGGGWERRGGQWRWGAWDTKYKRSRQKPDGAGSNPTPPPSIAHFAFSVHLLSLLCQKNHSSDERRRSSDMILTTS